MLPSPRGRPWLACVGVLLVASGCSSGLETPVRVAPRNPAAPAVTAAGVTPPAPAKAGTHVDTLHAVLVPDPYRFLEDTLDAATRTWVAEQERYTAAIIERLVGRDSLAGAFERAFRDAPTLGAVLETAAGLVLRRYLGDAPSLFVAGRDGSGERELLSADRVATLGEGTVVRVVTPSTDGRYLALGTTTGGDAGAAVALVDAVTGAMLPDRIPDLLTSTSGTRYQVAWLPEVPAFIYPRLWPGSDSGPPADRLGRARQFVHRLGTPQSADRPIFGFQVSASVPMEPEDLATRVHAAPRSRWLVGSVFRSRRNGSDHYAARRTPGDSTVPAWVPLLSLEDRAGYPQLRGDTAYALVRRNADRGRIVRRVLGEGPTPEGEWETVVPERRGVITQLAVQEDALYFTERVAGAVLLNVLPHGANTARTVSLPTAGTPRIAPPAPGLAGVLVSVESWASPPMWYRVTGGGARIETLAIDDGGRSRASATLVADRLEAPSRDGTLVPVSLVYDRAALPGGKLDGTAPLLIEAYGGFGQATDPAYDPTIEVWTSLGGVYAYAHVRGGGELGDAWHRAATRQHKQRSVDDVIGAVEAMIAHGYTSPGRVAFQGISFGAVLAGLVPLQRPDLFGAIVYDVGGPDEVRAAAVDPSAARNIAEIGDIDTHEGVQSLLAASPYHQVPARINLPAFLLHSAYDDYNFGTEMLVAKHVARLQAANAGERPVVWVRTAGGHRWLRFVSPEWAAVQTAFLLWQTGVPAYQPAAGAEVR